MILLNKRNVGKYDTVAVNPDHILFMYDGVRFDEAGGDPTTWTIIVLSHGGGPDRTELQVTQTVSQIMVRIDRYRQSVAERSNDR